MTSDPPSLSPLDRRWIKVLTHDLRVAILRHMLTVDTTTSKALASILGQPIGTISYHVRRLREGGQITLASEVQRRGAIARNYRLTNREATAAALDRVGLTNTASSQTATFSEDNFGASLSSPESRRGRRYVVLDLIALRQFDALAETLLRELAELERATHERQTGTGKATTTTTSLGILLITDIDL
jgi:DNA-binding transcriptional ArsR family regulator